MKEWINKIANSFIISDISTIKDYTLKFARKITKAILDNNNEELEELIDVSCEIRDNIEIEKKIDRNKEFYYGYWYAYENVANRIVEYKEVNENIDHLIDGNEKLRALVKFLGENKAAWQKDIAEHLDMKSNELANFMKTDYVKKVDILSRDEIGRNVIYSLNAKGRKYFKDQISETKNNYSKKDILKMLDYLGENSNKNIDLIVKEGPGLDEVIIKRIYSLIMNKEIAKYQNDAYINEYINKLQFNPERRSYARSQVCWSFQEKKEEEPNYIPAA